MSEISQFKVFVLCSGDVAADVDHLQVKRIHLEHHLYIFREDTLKYRGKRRTADTDN
jgi:hypothetical protein